MHSNTDQNQKSSDDSSSVSLIPPKVEYKDRRFTDCTFALLYFFSFLSFLACGFVLVSNSHSRFEVDEDGQRTIHEYYLEEVNQCCTEEDNQSAGGICYHLNSRSRRLQAGQSQFEEDEGIFDAFIRAPEIIVGLLAISFISALLWTLLMRYCARGIIFSVEVLKICIFIGLGAYPRFTNPTRSIFFTIAALLLIYVWVSRKKIILATKIMEESVDALRTNPSALAGGIFTKFIFALNAILFVFFYAKSFDVVQVKRSDLYCNDSTKVCHFDCHFSSPTYVNSMNVYLGISYLWTILLIDHIRLSIVAYIVGSYYLHPHDTPGLLRSILNTFYSFGTLAFSSLFTYTGEQVNRVMYEPCCTSLCSTACLFIAPLHILTCCFGACLKALLQMLTKYAVVFHVFTGKQFIVSGKESFRILSKHWIGGFVNEATSKSVLNLSSYAFSLFITMITWVWVNNRFDCSSLPSDEDVHSLGYFILFFFFTLFNVWFPVLGIYISIVVNSVLQRGVGAKLQHQWIPPLSAIFVGCIAMMFFSFLAGIFSDTVTVRFFIYAVEKENDIKTNLNETFETIIEDIPRLILDEHSGETDAERGAEDEFNADTDTVPKHGTSS